MFLDPHRILSASNNAPNTWWHLQIRTNINKKEWIIYKNMFYKAIKGKSFIVFNADVLLIFSPLGGTVSLQVKKCIFF